MKLVIEKSVLMEGIQIVSKAVPSKTTMNIMKCILVDASTDDICLIANDNDLGIQTKINGLIEERGVIAIDADIFANIVRKLPDSEVVLTAKGEKVNITCDNAKFDIMGKDGSEFVYLPEIEKTEEIEISQYSFREMIGKTIFSISNNESNKMMTGELLEIYGNTMRMVALDGHRIAIRTITMDQFYNNRKVIIPGKTLNEISKILSGDMERKIRFYFTRNNVLMEFDNTVVVSRLIEGEYFRIDQMLSTDYETKVKINRQELLSCIDRASLLVKEDDKKPIILMIRDDVMELKINSSMGSMDETIAIKKEGYDLNIGFNPKFMMDALRAISEEEIRIYLLSQKAPCFIRNDIEDNESESGEQQKYCYLVLPVNFINI